MALLAVVLFSIPVARAAHVTADPVPAREPGIQVGLTIDADVVVDVAAHAARMPPASHDGQLRPDDGERSLIDRSGPWVTPSTTTNRLVLVGDSLAQEALPFLRFFASAEGFVPKFWGGAAPCDWSGEDLEANRTSLVIITFAGNSLTECMRGADGRFLADESLVDQYRHHVGRLIDRARRSGARVLLVGQPRHAPSVGADVEVAGINEVYRDFARRYRFVSFVDAGASVENPDGTYADRLPCTPIDRACDPDGTTIVRGDGVHFCPIGGESPCSVWSSGAMRFALEIALAANDPHHHD